MNSSIVHFLISAVSTPREYSHSRGDFDGGITASHHHAWRTPAEGVNCLARLKRLSKMVDIKRLME